MQKQRRGNRVVHAWSLDHAAEGAERPVLVVHAHLDRGVVGPMFILTVFLTVA